jgi:hypothetical protein
MPMAMRRVLFAMAHQRDISSPPYFLNQPQSELLAVILDSLVGLIESNGAAEELTPVSAPKIRASHGGGPILREKSFAGTEIRHPLVIPRLLKTPPAYTRRQNPQPVLRSING